MIIDGPPSDAEGDSDWDDDLDDDEVVLEEAGEEEDEEEDPPAANISYDDVDDDDDLTRGGRSDATWGATPDDDELGDASEVLSFSRYSTYDL